MKKVLIFSMFMTCLCGYSFGQLKFGAKAGLNFTNFKSSSDLKLSNSTGWQVGLMSKFTVPLVGIGLQPELLYTVSKADQAEIGYLQIPINIRKQFLVGPVKPVIMGGPYFSYALNTKSDIKMDFEKLDWGIGIGGGLEIFKLQAIAKYSWGLQKVTKVGDLKNNVFSVSLGYFF